MGEHRTGNEREQQAAERFAPGIHGTFHPRVHVVRREAWQKVGIRIREDPCSIFRHAAVAIRHDTVQRVAEHAIVCQAFPTGADFPHRKATGQHVLPFGSG